MLRWRTAPSSGCRPPRNTAPGRSCFVAETTLYQRDVAQYALMLTLSCVLNTSTGLHHATWWSLNSLTILFTRLYGHRGGDPRASRLSAECWRSECVVPVDGDRTVHNLEWPSGAGGGASEHRAVKVILKQNKRHTEKYEGSRIEKDHRVTS